MWSPTLREEHRLWVFENRVLRSMSGPNRNEVTRGWIKLLHSLQPSPAIRIINKTKRMRRVGNVANMKQMKIVHKKTGREGVEWIHVAQDGDQWWTCEHSNEPLGSIKGWEFD
jgi:hypothetical protein